MLVYKDHNEILNCYEIDDDEIVSMVKTSNKDDIEKILEEYNEKENFNNYLKTIIKQIKQIESLVNEFSDFARMPKPVFQNCNIIKIIESNIFLLKEFDKNISIKLILL